VTTGLERLCAEPPAELARARVGLLCNQASGLADHTPAPEAVARALAGRLAAVFGPQHGFFADQQDNMHGSPHGVHPRLGVPVYSLYGSEGGASLRPAPEMLEDLDALLVDLTDVGCRVYTFAVTALYCLEAAARAGLAVWVLDRPNPLGRGEEGPILPPELESFVGPHAMPLRHGLSLGELLSLLAAERGLDAELKVLACRGWSGGGWEATGLPWVMPSPNLPTLAGARVYPGQVMLEGTTLSEGRGTTRPFEICGAPGLEPGAVAAELEPGAAAGAALRPWVFQPTFHKNAGRQCAGFMIHVTDPAAFRPVRFTCGLLSAISRAQPGLWGPAPPPYEFERQRRPLDLILGDPAAVEGLLAGRPAAELAAAWEPGLAQWRRRAEPHLLYPARAPEPAPSRW
jgi:uncharacterized protein YbbC (DUF1343 family)